MVAILRQSKLHTISRPKPSDSQYVPFGLSVRTARTDIMLYILVCLKVFNIFAIIMTDEELFRKMIAKGYVVCCVEGCPLCKQCLRWQVGLQFPETEMFITCINPKYESVGTEHCIHYKNAQKVLMARGMTQIFTDEMPKKVVQGVRNVLIKRYNRTYFFEYRNGKRLISPKMQDEIRQLFRDYGWNEEVKFDGYAEAYDW